MDALDLIVENDGEGVNEIRTSVENYVLPDTGVENLVINAGTLNGTGNSLANILTGNAGANSLTGSGGNDTLLGGQGGDIARFSSDMAEYVFGVTGNGAITVRHLADGGDDGYAERHTGGQLRRRPVRARSTPWRRRVPLSV